MDDKIECDVCNSKPIKKASWNAHLNTKKHIANTKIKVEEDADDKIVCEACKSTLKKASWKAHLNTKKHRANTKMKVEEEKEEEEEEVEPTGNTSEYDWAKNLVDFTKPLDLSSCKTKLSLKKGEKRIINTTFDTKTDTLNINYPGRIHVTDTPLCICSKNRAKIDLMEYGHIHIIVLQNMNRGIYFTRDVGLQTLRKILTGPGADRIFMADDKFAQCGFKADVVKKGQMTWEKVPWETIFEVLEQKMTETNAVIMAPTSSKFRGKMLPARDFYYKKEFILSSKTLQELVLIDIRVTEGYSYNPLQFRQLTDEDWGRLTNLKKTADYSDKSISAITNRKEVQQFFQGEDFDFATVLWGKHKKKTVILTEYCSQVKKLDSICETTNLKFEKIVK